MIFNITTENYNKTTKNLQNAGFKIDTVPLEFGKLQINQKIKTTSSGEDLISNAKEIERASLTVELPLPNFGKKLDDYASVMLWFNSPDGYMSYSLPFDMYETPEDITNPSEEQTKHINYKVYDGSCGNFIFKASVTNDDYNYFDLLADSDCYLMFLSTENLEFDYKRTVVVDSVQYFFNLCTAEDTKDYANVIFAEKTNLIAVNYDGTEQIAHCYKLSVCETNNASSEIAYDIKTLTYSQKGCAFKATTLPTLGKGYTVGQFGAIGYTQAELNNLTDEEKAEVSAKNVAALNSAADMCAQMGKEHCKVIELSFEPNLIYLLSSAIYFSSDTKFIGNNAIIRLYKNNDNANDVIVAFSNKRIIDTSDDYGNVGFYDLIVEGRYGSSASREDQAVKCEGNDYRTIPKNVRFCNCKFVDFGYGVHINNNKYYDVPLYWSITNCEFKTGMGFNLTGVKSLKLLNSHIDNCLSTDKFNHCIYVTEKCSYITVDRCLLENSTGGAIHQMFGFALYDSTFNEHNTYKNLTISSCFTAIHIGPASRDTVVENVVVFDSMRVIMLESCINTKIKNVKLAGEFYYKRLNSSDNKWYEPTYNPAKPNQIIYPESVWYLISLKGMVDADIEDCNFKFSSPFSSCCAYSNYMIGEEGASKIYEIKREGISVFENQKAWFKESTSTDGETFYLVTPSVRFKNCQFDSTYNLNNYTNVLGYQKRQRKPEERLENEDQAVFDEENNQASTNTFLIINNNVIKAKVAYKLKLNFVNCKFNLSYDTKDAAYFRSVGNTASALQSQSEYSFKNCNIAYFIESSNQDDVPSGYFMQARAGSSVTISDCAFYKNKGNVNAHNYLECKEGAYVTSENNTSNGL